MKDQLDKAWDMFYQECNFPIYRAIDGIFYSNITRTEVDIETARSVITLTIEDIILRKFGYSLSSNENTYEWRKGEHDVFFGLERDRLGSAMLVLEQLIMKEAKK